MDFKVKLGSAQAAVIAARGAQEIRSLSAKCASLELENTQLHAKVAQLDRAASIEAIAEEMERKGLDDDLTHEEKVAKLASIADLSPVVAAVKMASAKTDVRLSTIGSVDASPGRGTLDPLTAFATGLN